jgi:hypothetical protein
MINFTKNNLTDLIDMVQTNTPSDDSSNVTQVSSDIVSTPISLNTDQAFSSTGEIIQLSYDPKRDTLKK